MSTLRAGKSRARSIGAAAFPGLHCSSFADLVSIRCDGRQPCSWCTENDVDCLYGHQQPSNM
jgi:hypothetical protein